MEEAAEHQEIEKPLYTFPCRLSSHKGNIQMFRDRFQFIDSTHEEDPYVAISVSWSLIDVVQNQKLDSLTLEVANSIKWSFHEIDSHSQIFSTIDKFTRDNKDHLLGQGSEKIREVLENSRIVTNLFNLEEIVSEVPPAATQVNFIYIFCKLHYLFIYFSLRLCLKHFLYH